MNINLQNVSKIYKIDNQDFYAVKDINLSLSIYENTVLIGKSGCGKSTLLNIINRLKPQSVGVVSMPPNLKTATVFQEARLLPWLTLEQNAKNHTQTAWYLAKGIRATDVWSLTAGNFCCIMFHQSITIPV